MQCSAFPLQQHNTLCSSKPLAKYFFLNLFVMMQLNWKLKAISFIFHSQQETYFFFSFHLPFIYLYMCISLTYILSFYFYVKQPLHSLLFKPHPTNSTDLADVEAAEVTQAVEVAK